jgi:hypothetical protein
MKACTPGALFALVLAAPVAAAGTDMQRCAALEHLFRLGRTEFPKLAHENMSPGHCSVVRNQFKCRWGFAGDKFASAQDQASRLVECTAEEPRAQRLKSKHGETGFQLNPETSVFVRGPEMDSGEWAITLRIVSTADWN